MQGAMYMKSVHEGHRARLRRAFLSGAELEDHELLELLLTYAIPRADVNPLAHHLLDRFGGLEKVFQASPEELKELAGVGESAAVLIKTVQALQKRLLVRYYTAGSRRRVLFSLEEACAFALALSLEDHYETLHLICLDSKGQVLRTKTLAVGGVNYVSVEPRHVAQEALLCNARYVLLCHNHPSGDVRPSDADLQVGVQMKKSLEGIGIQLLDQLVAGQGAVYSQSRDKVLCFHGEAPCETLLPEEFARRYGFERSEREYDGFQHQAAEDCFPADDPFSWGGSSDLY